MRLHLRRLLFVGLGVTVVYELAVCAGVLWDRLTPAAGLTLVLPPLLVGLVGIGALLWRLRSASRLLAANRSRIARVDRRAGDITRRFDEAMNDIVSSVADIRATMGAHRMVFLDAFSRASWPTQRPSAADDGYRSAEGERP